MNLLLVGFSLLFSVIDIRSHRIPNRLLFIFVLLLSIVAYFVSAPVHLFSAAIIGALSIALLFLGLGAGDMKLATILGFFFLPTTALIAVDFLLAFSLISGVSLVIKLLRSRRFAGSIALAPAICGAVIWCAR
jgi:Flp pilus assembly protein protease CpaA